MRQSLSIFISLGLLFNCGHDKEINENAILTLPYGKYYNWVYWELKHLNFKVGDNKLLIDTTYKLKLKDFKTHYFESIKDYPEIAEFLKKPNTELQDIRNSAGKKVCGEIHEFWFQYDDKSKLNLIKFQWTNDCDSLQNRTLNLVFQEMEKLKDKYNPRHGVLK